MKLRLLLLLPISLLLLSGCVKRETQPLELVPARCNSANLPPRLSCIEGTQFERGDEFEACRMSVEIYLGALDYVYDCSYNQVNAHYSALKQAVQSTFDCYVAQYQGRHSVQACGAVEPPDYRLFDQIEGVSTTWGIPECVSATSLLQNPENLDSLQLSLCQMEVEAFMSEAISDAPQSSLGARSADRQFNDYMINLQKRIETEAAETISRFNCKGLAGEGCEAH